MSRALELFKRIRAGGAAEVERMIDDEVVEELFLDYKRSSTVLPTRKLAEDDRKNFAKAVGGFANSEGGVIVWGVDCRQTDRGDVSFGSKGGPGAAKEIVFPAGLLSDARKRLLETPDPSDAQNQEYAARLRQCVVA
jgi:hypothetical protein